MPKIPFGYLKRLPSTGSGWFAPRVCGTLKTMITSGSFNFSSAARNCPSYKLRLYTWRQRIQGPKHERSRAQTHLSATNKHWGHCPIIYFKSARDHIHALGTVCEVLRCSVMLPTSKMKY